MLQTDTWLESHIRHDQIAAAEILVGRIVVSHGSDEDHEHSLTG